MERKKRLKVLLDHTGAGKFEEVTSEIKTNNIILDDNSAVNIIISCCTACFNNIKTVDKLSEEHLMELLRLALHNINVVTEAQTTSYYQSMFYVCKLLILKKSYEAISKFQEFVLPPFISTASFNLKLINTCEKIWNSLYNFMVQHCQSVDTNIHDCMEKISYSLAEFGSKIFKTQLYMENFTNIQHCLICLKIPIANHEKIFFHSLKFYESCINTSNNVELSYVHYVNNFNKFITRCQQTYDYIQLQEVYNKILEKMQNHFQEKEYKMLIEMLEVCVLILAPPETNKKDLNDLITSLRNYINCPKINNFNEPLKASCNLVTKFSINLNCYFKNYLSDNWTKQNSIDNQIKVYNFYSIVMQILTHIPHKCTCNNKKCTVNFNIYEITKLTTFFCKLGMISFSQKPLPKEYKLKFFRILEREFVSKVQYMKDNNCEHWKMCWLEIGERIYNLSVVLSKNNDPDCLTYFKYFVKTTHKLEGAHLTVLNPSLVATILDRISDFYQDNGEFIKRFTILAYLILTYDTHKENSVLKWIRTKVIAKEKDNTNNLQELTIVSALIKYKSDLEEYNLVDIIVSENKQIELLIFELESYKSKWKSKIPMMIAFKELCTIADPFIITQTFVKIWGDCSPQVHDNIPNLLQQNLKLYEEYIKLDASFEKNIYLAYLYFLHYKYRIKDTILKNCSDMESTLMISNNTQNDVDKDANDECDIVSSYQSLKLDVHIQNTKYLSKSLNIFSAAFEGNFTEACFGTLDLQEVFKILVKIAEEYRLNCCRTLSRQAWELALKLAELINDNNLILTAISYLVENSDFSKNFVKNLIIKAEQLVTLLKNDVSNVENLKSIITFYIFKSQSLLYVDLQTAIQNYKKAQWFYSRLNQEESRSTLRARLKLLCYKLTVLPCKYAIEEHKKKSLVNIHSAYGIITELYGKSTGEALSEKSLIFEIVETMGKMYLELRMPREVRSYCKEAILLAQKLVLPLRSATLLIYLAEADLINCRLDDAKVKIEGLSDILCLSVTCKTITPQKCIEKDASCKENLEQEIDTLSNGVEEIMLDLPVIKVHFQQTSCSSPTLQLESFKLPGFFKHTVTCTCFYCKSIEYQSFVISKTRLEASLSHHKKNFECAQEFFIGSLKIYELILAKDKSSKIALIEAYCKVLLDYGNTLLKLQNKVAATEINKKLLDCLQSSKIQYIYLYNEALAQKLNILYNKPAIKTNNYLNVVDKNNALMEVKTPESKSNTVVFAKTYTPEGITPPKRVLKKLQFNLDFNDEATTTTSTTKTQNKNLFEIPQFCPKTPVPAIKIYSSSLSTVKSKSKSKRNNAPSLNTGFLVPDDSTSTAVSPPNLRAMKNLRSKTKLLTEKLKQGSASTANDENNLAINNNKKTTSVRNNTRKVRENLDFNITEEVQNSEETNSIPKNSGAIRKSSRNK